MASRKKSSRKARAKKVASKQLPVTVPAAEPVAAVEPMAEPVALARSNPKWVSWVPFAALVVPLLLVVLYIATRPAEVAAPGQSQSASFPSDLHVVSGQEGGTSSIKAADVLQSQSTGLQQTQQAAQSAGGQNLQAQTTINQSTAR